MLKARVQMRFQSKLNNDRIMVAVDMGIDSVQSLEDLADQGRECFQKRNAYTL